MSRRLLFNNFRQVLWNPKKIRKKKKKLFFVFPLNWLHFHRFSEEIFESPQGDFISSDIIIIIIYFCKYICMNRVLIYVNFLLRNKLLYCGNRNIQYVNYTYYSIRSASIYSIHIIYFHVWWNVDVCMWLWWMMGVDGRVRIRTIKHLAIV